ncbi:hypothetical protein ACQY0O_005245 [Thecaphora frezii]
MPSTGPSSSPNLAQLGSSFPTTPDRRSADIPMLAKPSQPPALTRVNSTPLAQASDDTASASTSVRDASAESSSDPSAMLTVAPPKPGPADTLYPSPSGGFVPSPEEGQDWRLKPPPRRRESKETPKDRFDASVGQPSSNGAEILHSRPSSGELLAASHASTSSPHPDRGSRNSLSQSLGAASRLSPSAPTRPPSIPASQETASLIADASSASFSRRNSQASQYTSSPRLRPLSTASNVSRRGLGGSSKELSPGDKAARRRRSGASTRSRLSGRPDSVASVGTALQGEDEGGEKPSSVASAAAPIIVRDYAFAESDPRFSGLRLTGSANEASDELGSEQLEAGEAEEEGGWGDLDEDEDEDEFVGDEGDQANLAEGVHRVLYEFVSESEHELSVQPDELVRVVGALEGGWAIVTKISDPEVKGIVPATYLEWLSAD